MRPLSRQPLWRHRSAAIVRRSPFPAPPFTAAPAHRRTNPPRPRSVLASYRARVEAEGEYDEEELPSDVMDALEGDKAKGHFAVGGGARAEALAERGT